LGKPFKEEITALLRAERTVQPLPAADHSARPGTVPGTGAASRYDNDRHKLFAADQGGKGGLETNLRFRFFLHTIHFVEELFRVMLRGVGREALLS